MPLYTYKCPSCSQTRDVLQSVKEPSPVCKRCIEASSNENDLICDFFNGSGTSAVASKLLNRRYIGFEINKEYVDITKLRLQEECVSTLY